MSLEETRAVDLPLRQVLMSLAANANRLLGNYAKQSGK